MIETNKDITEENLLIIIHEDEKLEKYLQQKINPPPPDPIQAKVFMMLPFIFTFLLATFPSGMVVYWTVNNVLSIGQQYILLKKQKKNIA